MSAINQIVFKQWYKPRNLISTKALNQKHLLYIATRPGAIPNPGCDFSLWGQIAGMDKIGNINLLQHAHRLIGQASERHTIYRAVLSVNGETALKYGLHDRAEWERLELAALLKAAYLPDALDLKHIKTPQLDDLGRELLELALELPTHGRLKYQFLPPEYKEKLNIYLEHVLQISDFAKLQQQYESLGIQLNQMYGTTPKLSEEYRAQAHAALYYRVVF